MARGVSKLEITLNVKIIRISSVEEIERWRAGVRLLFQILEDDDAHMDGHCDGDVSGSIPALLPVEDVIEG